MNFDPTAYRDATSRAKAFLKSFVYEKATDESRRTARAIGRALAGLPLDRLEKERLRATNFAALVE